MGNFDIQDLVQACAQNSSPDALKPALNAAQWQLFASYLQPLAAHAGQVLIQQGGVDRTIYLIASGQLTVHFEDAQQKIHLAIVEAGSAVGEGAFFTRQPRNATVQATTACQLWALPAARFTELSNRQPAIALELAMALGALVSRRLAIRPRRVAVT